MNIIVKKVLDIVNTLTQNISKKISRNSAAKKLLKLSDKQLVDVGLSRMKLMDGASAYPWKCAPVVIKSNFSRNAKLSVVVDNSNVSNDMMDEKIAA